MNPRPEAVKIHRNTTVGYLEPIDTITVTPVTQSEQQPPIDVNSTESPTKQTTLWELAPVVLVRKKSGELRLCVDYRKLNNVTRKDTYPLPRVDDTLDTLAGSCWFTTLDLISGYWQVPLHTEDQEKFAFTTPEGLFEFTVMPFGLCNAPATFQRLMDFQCWRNYSGPLALSTLMMSSFWGVSMTTSTTSHRCLTDSERLG